MYKLDRHLGKEFIVEDANGRMYVCYHGDDGNIHSIDSYDDDFITEPLKIYYRNTNYTGILRNSNKQINIVDCYWPSMSECNSSIVDIRAKIQFKDKDGEWYGPGDIDEIRENRLEFNTSFDFTFVMDRLKKLQITTNNLKSTIEEINKFTWNPNYKSLKKAGVYWNII